MKANPNLKLISRICPSPDRRASLLRCIPDILNYKTLLYVGAQRRKQFWDMFVKAGYEGTIIEVWPENVELLRMQDLKVVQADVRDCDKHFKTGEFDIVFWWHGPEHLKEGELFHTLKKLEEIALHYVILGCPWGNYKKGALRGNPYEIHKSHFEPKFFNQIGYNTESLFGRVPVKGNITAWKRVG